MKKAIPENELDKVPPKVRKLLNKAVKFERKDTADLTVYNRFTFTGHFSFEQFGQHPIAQDFRMQTMLEHAYEPVTRRLVISAKDTPIEPHWIPIEFVGDVILENRAGAGRLTTPTIEEVEELRKMNVIVRYKGANKGFRLRPGKLFIAEPEDASELILRAENEPVNINLYLFSR